MVWASDGLRVAALVVALLLLAAGAAAFLKALFLCLGEAAEDAGSVPAVLRFSCNEHGRIGSCDEPGLVGRRLPELAAPSMRHEVAECCKAGRALEFSIRVDGRSMRVRLEAAGAGELRP